MAALKAAGRRVICYVNAGAFEEWRPDAKRFPKAVLGKDLDGWPGERWLDIRQWGKLEPILAARFDTCRAKGFDAVEPDNVDGYANDSGFPLTAADQLTFNRRVADLAHHTRQADILVAAAGSPGLITADMVRPGAAVVGAGATYEGRKLLSDVTDDVADVAGWITPRIGGVGPMTRAMLLTNTVEAAERAT